MCARRRPWGFVAILRVKTLVKTLVKALVKTLVKDLVALEGLVGV